MTKKFFPYLKYLLPVKKQLLFAVITGIIYGMSTGLGIPVLIKFIYPKIFSHSDLNVALIFSYASLPILVTILRSGSSFLNTYFINYCGQFLLEQIRLLVFKKIQRLPVAFFKKFTSAELITRLLSDTGVLQNSLIEFSQDIIKQPITLIGTISCMIYLCVEQSNVSFLIIFLLAIPLFILPIRIIGKRLRKKALEMQRHTESVTRRLTENLGAVEEVRSYCMEESEEKRFRDVCLIYIHHTMKVVKYTVILSPIIEIVAAVGVSVAFFYAYRQNIEPEIFFSIIAALYLSYEPIKKMGRLNNEIQKGLASLERLEVILAEPESIKDPEKHVSVKRLQGHIEFQNINFAYEETPVLINVSESLESGKTYALVGHSGAGKTTFANLIPRFYDPISGSIRIDGINLKDMRIKDLRQNIGFVGQSPTLFHDTIYNNILVGKPDASKEEVIIAAKKAYAHEFIESLEKGYDTDAGDDGNLLSGGQRQRIAIARAFLKDAPIIILDEATSALDAISESYIQKALETLFIGKTVIIIAHRFSSIMHADTILVFNEGSIVERGNHEQLSKLQGIYYRLYQKQIK